MFERFTTAARHVVVLAQEEARELDHNYIGTEHLLLGLLSETEGIAARALAETNLSIEMTRSRIVAAVGRGKKPPSGHIPFTPRAKKVLERSLREALGLRHNYIGTEHILLGILEMNDGLATILLRDWGIDFKELRKRVLELVTAAGAEQEAGDQAETGPGRRRRRAYVDSGIRTGEKTEQRQTAATVSGLANAIRYAGQDPVGSHHVLRALLTDPNSAATRTLTSLGLDVAAAQQALEKADLADTSDELPETAGRRGMSLRLTDSALVLEATDRRLLGLARLAFGAWNARKGKPGTPSEAGRPASAESADPAGSTEPADGTPLDVVIGGDDDVTRSLSAVWTVLEASLEDIRARSAQRAKTAGAAPDAAAGPDGDQTDGDQAPGN
jgi:ATP-dependent Clp protease ATP-binding subunit ClpC